MSKKNEKVTSPEDEKKRWVEVCDKTFSVQNILERKFKRSVPYQDFFEFVIAKLILNNNIYVSDVEKRFGFTDVWIRRKMDELIRLGLVFQQPVGNGHLIEYVPVMNGGDPVFKQYLPLLDFYKKNRKKKIGEEDG